MLKGLFKNHTQFSTVFIFFFILKDKNKKGVLVFRYTLEIETNSFCLLFKSQFAFVWTTSKTDL